MKGFVTPHIGIIETTQRPNDGVGPTEVYTPFMRSFALLMSLCVRHRTRKSIFVRPTFASNCVYPFNRVVWIKDCWQWIIEHEERTMGKDSFAFFWSWRAVLLAGRASECAKLKRKVDSGRMRMFCSSHNFNKLHISHRRRRRKWKGIIESSKTTIEVAFSPVNVERGRVLLL